MKIKLLLTLALTGLLNAQSDQTAVKMQESNVVVDVDPKLVKYIDKSYLDLSRKGYGNIDKIISSSVNSCVLLENKIIYCEYGDKKEIKVQIQTRKDNEISQVTLLLMQQDVLEIKEVKKPTIDDKNKSLKMEIKELRMKLENLYTVIDKQKEQINIGLKYKQEVKDLKKEIEGYDEIIKKNTQLCEVEKTEILSLTKNKNYKSLEEYTDSTKQLLKIKEQRESIQELLAIIDKYKNADKKSTEKTKEESKTEKSGISKYFSF